MDVDERQKSFKSKISEDPSFTPTTVNRDAFGVSNSAKFIENGIYVFNANLDNGISGFDQVVVNCLVRFPPADEIYFSLFIKNAIQDFASQLDAMIVADTWQTPNNKNVKGYIARNGNLYLLNKGYHESLPEDLSTMGTAIAIDKVVYSVYPAGDPTLWSPFSRQFIRYLRDLIGLDKLYELRAWSDDDAINPEMRRMPHTIPFAEIEANVKALGGYYPGGEVQRFHAGLNYLDHKHFVIVQGVSGTGKTQLALKYARAVHGVSDMGTADPFIVVCPVRPEWTDPTALTGYYDVLSNRYNVPPFLEAVILAEAHPTSPVFVVLDEMNLARIEYYLSDVLSCIETGEPLHLHPSNVPLEGSNGRSIPPELDIPRNLFVTGTINIDETTNPISDKVLDRAMMINMSGTDVSGFLNDMATRESELQNACGSCQDILEKAHQLMAAHGLEFGYRVAEEVVRYLRFAEDNLGIPVDEAKDQLMVQKVLLKLRGNERQRNLLTGLLTVLNGLPRSEQFLNRLLEDLNQFSSFQAAR